MWTNTWTITLRPRSVTVFSVSPSPLQRNALATTSGTPCAAPSRLGSSAPSLAACLPPDSPAPAPAPAPLFPDEPGSEYVGFSLCKCPALVGLLRGSPMFRNNLPLPLRLVLSLSNRVVELAHPSTCLGIPGLRCFCSSSPQAHFLCLFLELFVLLRDRQAQRLRFGSLSAEHRSVVCVGLAPFSLQSLLGFRGLKPVLRWQGSYTNNTTTCTSAA